MCNSEGRVYAIVKGGYKCVVRLYGIWCVTKEWPIIRYACYKIIHHWIGSLLSNLID